MTEIPPRPALRRDVRVEHVAPNHVFLLSEDGERILTGNAFARVIARLDGDLTTGALITALAGEASAPEVQYVLQRLAEAGLLAPGGAGVTPERAAFWHAAGIDPATADTRLAAAQVALRGLDGADPAPLAAALGGLGIALGDADGAGLEIVVAGHYLDPALEAINARALADGRRWMLVKPHGAVAWIGPVMQPGRTACWRCLAERLRHNRQVEQFVAEQSGSAPPQTSLVATRGSVTAAAAIAATAVAELLAADHHALETALRTVDAGRLELRDHAVVRRPQCPACGDPSLRSRFVAPQIGAVALIAAADGGDRAASAEQTLTRLRPSISPITGVVNYLEPAHGLADPFVHSYAAGHNFAMGPATLYWLKRSLRTQTGGKGMTQAQAQVSAVGEAIERYCGVHRGDEPAVRASFAALGDEAVHPAQLLHFSERQYDERDAWNGSPAGADRPVPNRFDASVEIDWAPAWSLAGERVRYLPSGFCQYGHPDSARHFFCSGDTNGCAAGSTLEEAIVQAFFELVERDCVATWWYNRLRRPAVDLDAVGLPYVDRLRAHYATLGRELWVLDLTSDLEIACYAAVSRRRDRPVEDIVFGFGAHADPQVALLRAITECNQFLPAVLRQDARGATRYLWPDDEAIRFWREETVARQPWLAPDPAAPARVPGARPAAFAADLGSEVRACVDVARVHGLDVLVVDQSHPDIELAVARVVVPGLRHFWRRLGPGRLYDVPVRMGWLDAPLQEAQLNPLSVFI